MMTDWTPSERYESEKKKSDALEAQNATLRNELARLKDELEAANAIFTQAIVHTTGGNLLNIKVWMQYYM